MKKLWGLLLCLLIAIPATFLGKVFPVAGAPVIAIFIGMAVMPLVQKHDVFAAGLTFTSKKILQTAVVLLGFSLSLTAILKSGSESLPIIIGTISISLIMAYFLKRLFKIDANSATLIGVGSAICGGSAIAATAPVIEANDEEVAQSIAVIFLFNIVAAITFPSLGKWLAMSDYGFGVFAGTAINDTSSVTAAASIWDSLYQANALQVATVVKLTRTLAIIPIVFFLSVYKRRQSVTAETTPKSTVGLLHLVPKFLILFLMASLVATLFDLPAEFIHNSKWLSKFLITMAMAAIGLKTNFIHLIKTGGKAILLGFCCWLSIIMTSLLIQYAIGLI